MFPKALLPVNAFCRTLLPVNIAEPSMARATEGNRQQVCQCGARLFLIVSTPLKTVLSNRRHSGPSYLLSCMLAHVTGAGFNCWWCLGLLSRQLPLYYQDTTPGSCKSRVWKAGYQGTSQLVVHIVVFWSPRYFISLWCFESCAFSNYSGVRDISLCRHGERWLPWASRHCFR